MAALQGFVHPELVGLLALASVPIAIHLLNRQRHRPLEWGAMRLVQLAHRKTRRRAQLENLLLLLLRAGAVALLALAVARPFTSQKGPLAALTETRRDLVLLLDSSASTGYRERGGSSFERILAHAREKISALDSARGDRVRLITAASSPRVLSERSPEEALSLLSALSTPADEPLDLAAALAEVARLIERDAGAEPGNALELRLLTDLQRRNFTPSRSGSADSQPGDATTSAPADQDALQLALNRLQKLGLRCLVEDLGPSAALPPNLGVDSIEPLGSWVGPLAPVEVAVRVRNYGGVRAGNVRVSLSVDGARRANQTLEIAAQSSAQAIFPVTFAAGGHHTLEARLDADALACDDARCAVLWVPENSRVLLIDGAASSDLEQDAIGYLATALQPLDDGLGGPASAPFEALLATPADLSGAELDLSVFDAIWLADVEGVSLAAAARLQACVAAGAALIVSAGPHLDPKAWNERLWRADESGLLPAELGARVEAGDRRSAYWRVASFEATHPALAFFGDERWRPLLTELPIYAFLASRPAQGTRVLASLDDARKSPLLLERDYDRGRVILWTSSVAPVWNRLALSPRTLVPLLHELLRYACTPTQPGRNLAVGQHLVAEVENFPRRIEWVSPDGGREPMREEPQALADGVWRLTSRSPAQRAGLWRMAGEGVGEQLFALQMEPAEGDLERLALQELATLHPALVPAGEARNKDRGASDQPDYQGELWRALALACLLFLAGESLWAAWIGRRRR